MRITKEEARQELEQAREDLFELEISEPGSEQDYLEKQQEISDARRWISCLEDILGPEA